MALRAGYYGLKRSLKDKLFNLAASTPADISPDNPIAGKNDVLVTVGLLKDTTGWIVVNHLDKNNSKTYNANATDTSTGINVSCINKVNANVYFDLGNSLGLNKQYKVSSNVDYTSGNGAIVVMGSNDGITYNTIIESIENITADGKKILSFNTGTYPYIRISLFATRATALDGNISFNDLMLYDAKYIEPAYEPYHASVSEMLDGKMSIGSVLTSADDLNDADIPGLYGILSQPINSPTSYGTLLVNKRSDGGINHIIFKSNEIYTRGFGGSPSAWSSWYKFTGTEVTPPSPTPENETKKATKKKVIKED